MLLKGLIKIGHGFIRKHDARPNMPHGCCVNRSSTEKSMNEEYIRTLVQASGKVSADNRLDVELYANGSFLCTEVAPDLSVISTISGYVRREGGIALSETMPLTMQQAAIFDHMVRVITPALDASDASGVARSRVATFGDFPELFDVTLTNPNIAGNVHNGMIPVINNISHAVERRGYGLMVLMDSKPSSADWQLVAEKRR